MIYSVKHFWYGDAEPSEYFVSSDGKPSQRDVVSALEIDFSSEHDEIVIKSLEVLNMKEALRLKGVKV